MIPNIIISALAPLLEDSVLHFIGALNSLKGFFPQGKT